MIGIYAMYWEGPCLIYVGQTTTNSRFTDHIYELKNNKHYNYKLQNAYNKYGKPAYVVLEECNIAELDKKENEWMREFNSHITGLNLVYGQGGLRGTDSGGAIYSKATILKIFSLLSKTTLNYALIENRLKVGTGKGTSIVSKIASSNAHMWLKEEYPDRYQSMLEKVDQRYNRDRKNIPVPGKEYPTIVDPDGNLFNIVTIAEFCRTHPKLEFEHRNHISELLAGKTNQYKGFRVYNPDKGIQGPAKPKPSLIGPNGEIYKDIPNVAEFCRTHPLLKDKPHAKNNMGIMIRGGTKHYLGFKLLKDIPN